MILWILMMHNSTFQLIQKNKKTISQKIYVLLMIKKNTDIRIVSWIYTVKYVKLLHLMRMNKLSLSEKHMSCLWQAWKYQIRSILHFFMLSYHVLCFQMNWKTNHSEIKLFFRIFNQEMKKNRFLECWQQFFCHKWWNMIYQQMKKKFSY